MKSIKTTLGITCFNAEQTIERTILSALNMIVDDVEILIVDDNSNDNSIQIIQSFINHNYPITLIQNKTNQGVACARNTLIKYAKGTFLAYLDDDDEIHPDRLTKQEIRLLQAEEKYNTKDILCFGNRTRIEQDGAKKNITCIGNKELIPHGEMIADFFLFHKKCEGYSLGRVGTCTMFGRVETFKKFLCFDIIFRRAAEIDLVIRMALKGAYFVGINEPVITQYMTNGEDDEKNYKANIRYYGLLIKKHKEYLIDQNIYLFAKYKTFKAMASIYNKRAAYYKYLLLCIAVRPEFLLQRIIAKCSKKKPQ